MIDQRSTNQDIFNLKPWALQSAGGHVAEQLHQSLSSDWVVVKELKLSYHNGYI